MAAKIYEAPEFHNKTSVFRDRDDAGRILSEILSPYYKKATNTIVLAIPSGGVPIGLEVARGLSLPLDLMITRKIPIPGNPEAGLGAIALEGDVLFNNELISYLQLSPGDIETLVDRVKKDLEERNRLFRQGQPLPDVSHKTVLMADDGLASGYTMLASIEMLRRQGVGKIAVVVPTASEQAIFRISQVVEEIFCANIRTGRYFAVAEAYVNWYDLSQDEVLQRLQKAGFRPDHVLRGSLTGHISTDGHDRPLNEGKGQKTPDV